MKNEEIVRRLNDIPNKIFLLDEFKNELQLKKEDFVKQNDQKGAKQTWIYQTVVEIHSLYQEAFSLLQSKQYYEGWCKLERIEIAISGLKRHFHFDKTQFRLWQIEKNVKNLQVIFPYKIFASSEILKKKKKCSICDKEITIRKPCGHIVGEIYNGEMCHRVITEAEVLGLALVKNPSNKYSVPFLTDEKTGKQIDQYNYNAVEYLFNCIKSPYDFWELEVSQKETKKEDFGKTGRNDDCPCHSGKKFKKCCMENIGKKYPHYEFILKNPSDETFLLNTTKKHKN